MTNGQRCRRAAVNRISWFGLLGGALLGCSSKPSRIDPPKIDASSAGAEAVALYDKNSDGAIAADELAAAPALAAAQPRIDADGDGRLTAAEIAARIQLWQDSRIGIMSYICLVTLDGQPLEGATVTLEPLPFLGSNVKAASGVTDAQGGVLPSLAAADLPDANASGVQPGWYLVRITKMNDEQETIPARYNASTTLVAEVDRDAMVDQALVTFRLSSR